MTRIFGVIGHPIEHSLSPAMHAAAFRALRLDAFYAPFDAPPTRLAALLDGLWICGIDGLNVTIPHKEAVFRLLQRHPARFASPGEAKRRAFNASGGGVSLRATGVEGASRVPAELHGSLDPTAAAIGAVNTLARGTHGFIRHNTDVIGIERTLREELKTNLSGARVVVLGAGGAAKALLWTLSRLHPGRVRIANRTASKVAALRRWWRGLGSVASLEAIAFERKALRQALEEADVLINATSLGLKPGDRLPIDPSALHRRLRVLDLVYASPATALVRSARRRGALAVDGRPMLVYQGAAAFELWWNRQAPVEAMRRAVDSAARKAEP